MNNNKEVSTASLRSMKERKDPIAVITAYDFPSAMLAEEAGADMLLVGDSLGMVVLGYESTIPVTLDDMVHHTKAVTRAARRCFVVSDLPFATYHGSADVTLANASRLMREGLAKAVKMEGGREIVESVAVCVKAGIPVVGHIGLTPQAVHQLGGYKIQGRLPAQARKLLDDALALEAAGAFAIVLELVPEPLAKFISEQLNIPTIGIGAGRFCDGQVLVYHDLLQYGSPLAPKFAKSYAALGAVVKLAISQYVEEVKSHRFPEAVHAFSMDEQVIDTLYGGGLHSAPDKAGESK
jgi:3-methyl-2-oxobutanoate hydroxymethyltransferase